MNQIQSLLQHYWGYSAFRPLQQEIISSVLAGADTLALLPTGGGKSICYQVPALVMDGTVLVISPLIALMQDQVAQLSERGIPAACIYAGMKPKQVAALLQQVVNGTYKLLYISPERMQTRVFKQYLPHFSLSLIAVDEAHCVSQWGHDFRPDYLKIAELRDIFPRVPMLALTASATKLVEADIIKQLKLRRPETFRQSFDRQNIDYTIHYSENKPQAVREAVQQRDTTIIYCRSRKLTEVVTKQLTQHDIPAITYHAGMSREKRDAAQQAWMKGEVSVMVATTAFGMGIDKADVRLVIHYDAPENLEAYYQEAGRAGRDGNAALAVALYNSTDIKKLNGSTADKFPPEAFLRKVYQSVAEYLQIPAGNELYQYFSFELPDFCKKFSLPMLQTSSAMRLLEQEGLWTLSDAAYHPPTAYFTAERETLDALPRYHPFEASVALAMLRLYSGIFQFPVGVSAMVIAKKIKVKKAAVEQALVNLNGMGIIEYSVPTEGAQLFFHHLRVPSEHLRIDLQRIRLLREQHIMQTEAMTHFLQQTDTCRSKVMLQYFGETVTADCGHCDVCHTRKAATRGSLKADRATLLGIIKAQPLSLRDLYSRFPATAQEQLAAQVRQLIDEGTVLVKKNGSLYTT